MDIEEQRRRNRERMRKWYQENRELARERANKRARSSPEKEKIKARSKRYYAEKKEELAIKGKKWRDANPDKIKQKRRNYYDSTREQRIIRSREWYKANKDRKVEYDRQRKKEILTNDPEYFKKYRIANVDRIKVRTRQKRVNNPARYLFYGVRGRALKRGILFDLTLEDIVVPEFCPVLGIPLKMGVGRHSDNSPSVDRINPKLGYVKGNIAVISYRANAIKQNATADEIRAVADWVDKMTK